MTSAVERLKDTVWRRNIVWAQMLGLCPLLAVSSTVANALGLALASLFVLTGSNASVAAIRRWIPSHLRLPAFMLVIAGFTTAAMLVMQAYAFELYSRIALFVQIIVTNCIILARAEQLASREPVGAAVADGVATGLAFAAALIVLGMARELIGHGTLFADMALLFGPVAADWTLTIERFPSVLLAALPPGAFIMAGLLIALRNWLASDEAGE